MIENPKAPRIRKAAALARKKDRLFVGKLIAEGAQAVGEALMHAPDDVEIVYATHDGRSRAQDLDRLADTAGATIEMVTQPVMDALTDTVTPQGVAAVVRLRNAELSAITQKARLVAVLHEVRDPGNAGAVLRAADAAGADAVIVSGDSVDPWHPKVVRATTGSLFHLPVVYGVTLEETLDALSTANITTVAADIRGDDLTPTDETLTRPVAWVFGNEAHGLSGQDRDRCDRVRKLPIYGKAESLNLATAASVCLYTTAFAQREVGDHG